MDFQTFQNRAMETAMPSARTISYMLCNLAAESGEVLGKYAKAGRDGWSYNRLCDEIAPELADVLWMVAGCCEVLGLSMDEIAQGNLAKLKDRQARGVISGSGDRR